MELDADDDQLDFPVVYATARDGIAKLNMADESSNLEPLFKLLIENIPSPKGDIEGPLQVMVTTLDYDEYVGRIAIGRVVRGRVKNGQNVTVLDGENQRKGRIGRLYGYEGLKRREVEEAAMGDIIAVTGLDDVNIGDTIADTEKPRGFADHCD